MSNNNKARVIDRIKKLLGIVDHGGASDGEIQNAMEMASKLIAEYQVDKTELEDAGEEPDMYARKFAKAKRTKRYMPWMGYLAAAVADMVGSVGSYTGYMEVREGVFGKPNTVRGNFFYGPEGDVEIATAIYEEWLAVVATIAAGRYGSPFMGQGKDYALGFAVALREISREAYKKDYTGTKAIVVVNTLAAKREEGKAWLQTTHGVRLMRGRRATANSHDAYSAGKEDGAKSGFGFSRNAIGGRK